VTEIDDKREELIDFGDKKVKLAYRTYINIMMRKKHLHYGHLAKACDIKTVERYFKGPFESMPKKLPESRIYDFLDAVGSCYDDFLNYYQHLPASADEPCITVKSEASTLAQKEESESSIPPVYHSGFNRYIIHLQGLWCHKWFRLFLVVLFILCVIASVVLLKVKLVKGQGYIEQFYAVTPVDNKSCYKDVSFRKGTQRLINGSVLYSGDCFALKLLWRGGGNLYLFSSFESQLTRLFPNSCNALGYKKGLPDTFSQLTFPLDRQGLPSMFRLDDNSGTETIIALAVSSDRMSVRQQEVIASMPDKCGSLSEPVFLSMEQLSLQSQIPWEKDKDWFSVKIEHK
jgi:hypothetical protein